MRYFDVSGTWEMRVQAESKREARQIALAERQHADFVTVTDVSESDPCDCKEPNCPECSERREALRPDPMDLAKAAAGF